MPLATPLPHCPTTATLCQRRGMDDDSDEWKWWIPTGLIVLAFANGLLTMLMRLS